MLSKYHIEPILPGQIVGPWKLKSVKGADAVICGQWHEDGSEYEFTVPHQLVDCFLSLQQFAVDATKLIEGNKDEKYRERNKDL